MSISKTTFTGTTLAANAPEVLAFLQANAGTYFDTVTADANGNVKCTINNVDVLKIGFDGTEITTLTLLNGESVANKDATGGNGTRPFVYGYVCGNGVMLVDNAGCNFIITKTNENTTAIIAIMHNTTNTTKPSRVVMGDVLNDLSWFYLGAASDTYTNAALARAVYVINGAATLTTLTPLPLGDGGTYCPNCYVTTWTENGGITTPKKLVINGNNYVYDGAFAIKD